jgi:phospho-N-acetylmuramoyl-pentapeptide-transferase
VLYLLLFPLHSTFPVFNVFRYITFRAALAALVSLLLSFIIGPYLIRALKQWQIGQPIREDGPDRHASKAGTPTMGGTLIVLSLVLSTVLVGDVTNVYVLVALAVTVGFAAIGFVDDILKVRRKSSRGLGMWSKLLPQMAVAGAAAVVLLMQPDFSSTVAVPFFKNVQPDFGIWYVPFAVLVVVGTSNAVNLTDGLDGLAIGPVMTAAATYAIIVYLAGHVKFAEYLQIPYVSGVGEMSVFCAAVVAASLGFLWFNAYPAQMFMGDVGSLGLGAALGSVAVISKNEILLVVVGGVFVVEAVSVIVQVASFKLRGKRVFRMAPIHHHYELKGWAEPQIIVRFWIVSIICALFALSTLKLR